MLRKFIHCLHKFRIDVIALYFSIQLTFTSRAGMHDALIVSTAFTLWIAFAYIFNRVTDFEGDAVSDSTQALKSNKWIVTFLICLLAGSLYFFLKFKDGLLTFIFFLFLSIAYSIKFKNFQIRKIFLIKNLWAAGSWYISLMAAAYLTVDYFSVNGFFERTWYVFVYMIGFQIFCDLKDVVGDAQTGTKTLPVVIGQNRARLVALLCMLPHVYFVLTYARADERIIMLLVFTYVYVTKVSRLNQHVLIYGTILFQLFKFIS